MPLDPAKIRSLIDAAEAAFAPNEVPDVFVDVRHYHTSDGRGLVGLAVVTESNAESDAKALLSVFGPEQAVRIARKLLHAAACGDRDAHPVH